MKEPIKVLLYEDKDKELIESYLSQHAEVQCIGCTDRISQIIDYIIKDKPDVVLVDLHIETSRHRDQAGFYALNAIKNVSPQTKVIILSGLLDDKARVFESIRYRADGYFYKQNYEELYDAILKVLNGEVFIDSRIAEIILSLFPPLKDDERDEESPEASTGLTKKESQVLQTMARGISIEQASRELSCTTDNINKHLKQIYKKLRVHNLVNALIQGRLRGFILEPGVFSHFLEELEFEKSHYFGITSKANELIIIIDMPTKIHHFSSYLFESLVEDFSRLLRNFNRNYIGKLEFKVRIRYTKDPDRPFKGNLQLNGEKDSYHKDI